VLYQRVLPRCRRTPTRCCRRPTCRRRGSRTGRAARLAMLEVPKPGETDEMR
jgi:hypothetical protein